MGYSGDPLVGRNDPSTRVSCGESTSVSGLTKYNKILAYYEEAVRTYAIIDFPSGPIITLGGLRKLPKRKILGSKIKHAMSGRVASRFNRLVTMSSWV